MSPTRHKSQDRVVARIFSTEVKETSAQRAESGVGFLGRGSYPSLPAKGSSGML